MSTALFNDQQTLAGQKLGISTAKAVALMVMASGLGAMNIYHMGNAVTHKLLTPDSSLLLFALLYFIAACIAFIEVPVTEEIVTTEARGRRATGHRILLGIIACMAMGAGVYSITTDAEKSDATRTAHRTNESSFEDLKQGLISDRNIARSKATTSAEISQANGDYFRALAALKKQQANHQATRPPEAVTTGSFWHWLWACGFSFLCSVGVIAITNYLTKYYKPLTEIPRVFFRTKEDQEWAMEDDDVRVIPAQVDLTNGQSNASGRTAMQDSPAQSKTDSLTSTGKRADGNRPAPDDSTVGAVLKGQEYTSERSLEEGGKKPFLPAHYALIRQAIIDREFNPTQAPVKSKLVRMKIQFIDDAARQRKAVEILNQLEGEGVIIPNPDQEKTKRNLANYVVNPDYNMTEKGDNKAVENLADEDEEDTTAIGAFDIVTRCPQCNDYTITDIMVLVDDQKHIARCDCGHNYVGHTHIATGFNPVTRTLLAQARKRQGEGDD